MGRVMRIVYLLFMTIIVACSGVKDIKREIKKSKLMLEYDWPEPKNLKRLPHPKSCHHFYHIRADGHAVMKKCHGDKIFDYQTLLCRKESLAKCWNNMLYKKDKSNIKKVRHHFSCPYSWGLYPNPEDCTLFYECLGGIIFSNKCPHAMLFDKVERTCVHSSKATCAEYSDISSTENSQESLEMRTDFNDNFSRKENSITTNIHIKPTKTLEIPENTSDERANSEEQKSTTVENTYSTKYLTKFSIVLNKTIKPEQIKILHKSSEENNSEENVLEKKGMQTNTNAETKFMAGISVANKPHEKIVTEIKHTSSVTLTEKDRNTKTPSKISDLFSTTSAVKPSGDTNVRIKPATENVAFKKAAAVSHEMSFEEDNSLEEKGVHSKY